MGYMTRLVNPVSSQLFSFHCRMRSLFRGHVKCNTLMMTEAFRTFTDLLAEHLRLKGTYFRILQ